MPATVVINTSSFNVNGYKYPITLSSVINATSTIQPSVGPSSLNSSIVNASAVTTENSQVFHASEFNILLERSISLNSVINPRTSGIASPQLSVDINSYGIPDISHELALNSLQSFSTILSESSVDVRSVVPPASGVTFGTLTFQSAKRDSDDKITAITENKLAEFGISEPLAYTRTISIRAETDYRQEHDALISLIGARLALSVYGIVFPDCTIDSISDLQVLDGCSRFRYTIQFSHTVLSSDNVVQFGGVSLSHATRSAPDDISPSFIGNTNAGHSITNLVATVKRTWTFECIAESATEYTALVSLFGIKAPLEVNGESFTNVYINGISKLIPRGTDIHLYTIELMHDSGDDPIPVSFAGASLPNATPNGGDVEVLQSRTVLHTGKVAVDLGTIPSRSLSFSCMSNSMSEHDAVYSKLGSKGTLIVDGRTISSKCYISQLSMPVKRGNATNAIYTWDIEFMEETK